MTFVSFSPVKKIEGWMRTNGGEDAEGEGVSDEELQDSTEDHEEASGAQKSSGAGNAASGGVHPLQHSAGKRHQTEQETDQRTVWTLGVSTSGPDQTHEK